MLNKYTYIRHAYHFKSLQPMNDCSIMFWIGFYPGRINLSLLNYRQWHQYHVFKLPTTSVYMQLLYRCTENLFRGILNKPVVCISVQEVKSPTSCMFSPSLNIFHVVIMKFCVGVFLFFSFFYFFSMLVR